MSEFFQVLPSISLSKSTTSSSSTASKDDALKTSLKKPKCASGALPSSTISKLVRGANDFLACRKDEKGELEREETRRLEERKQILALRMKNATSLSQWTAAAQELDQIEGNHHWKSELNGVDGVWHPEAIRARMRELDEARTNCDIRRMVHLVRTALTRELGGMGNIDLYRHSYIGTKDLIEQYVQSAVKTIEDLVEKSGYPGALPESLDHHDILEAFLQTRQSFGRSALLLSGGGTFGMTHAGVMKAMFEADLLPRIVSGASAGSIVCAVFCTRTVEEVPEVIETFPYGDLAVFEEEGKEQSTLDHVKRLLTEGSWSDINHLIRVMRGMLGDITFQEAYNRTRKICNISVSTESIYELPRLLNYITAPNVMIWSAVAASCSVPFVFSAAPLLVKDPQTGQHMPWNPTPQKWVDGSVDNDLPMTRLAEMFNVNHFIVSQVNPHVVPFLAKDDRLYPEHDGSRPELFGASHNTNNFTTTLTTLAKDEALHRLQFLAELGIFPTAVTKLRSVISQKYSGDITILPEFSVHDLPRILKNPNVEFMERATLSGARATWPKLSRIRDRCAVELAIDKSIQILRARCLFSQSQVNLRRLVNDTKSLGSKTSFAHGLYRPAMTESPQEQIKLRRQARRGSGSSLQMLTRHRKHLLDSEKTITDDDTEEEERLEMQLRRDGANVQSVSSGRYNATNRPRMKKGSLKGLQQAPLLNLGPMTNPFPAVGSGDEASEFDFSKPLSPPSRRSMEALESSETGRRTLLRSPIVLSRSSPQLNSTTPSSLRVISPMAGDDLDTTSERSQTVTDVDADSRTEEDSVSDPERFPPNLAVLPSEGTGGHAAAKAAERNLPSDDDSTYGTGLTTADDDAIGRAHSPSAAALADDEQDTTDGDGMSD